MLLNFKERTEMMKKIIIIVSSILVISLIITGIIWHDNTRITIKGYDETEVTTFPLSEKGALMLGEKAIREKLDLTNYIIRNVRLKIIYETEEENKTWLVYQTVDWSQVKDKSTIPQSSCPAVRINKSDGTIIEFFYY